MKQNCNDCGGESLACVAEIAGSERRKVTFAKLTPPGCFSRLAIWDGGLATELINKTADWPRYRIVQQCGTTDW